MILSDRPAGSPVGSVTSRSSLVSPALPTWIYTVVDIFMRPDIGALAKYLWVHFVLFVPLLGMFIYLIARPDSFELAAEESVI